jgi:hypothetical protein
MTFTSREIIVWAPRVTGLGLATLLSLFALDAFSDGRGIISTTVAFAMGLLPALVVLITVVIGWKHEAVAATIFTGLTIFYAASALNHPSWIVIIAGPLALVGALFFASWRSRTRESAAADPGRRVG